MKFKRISDGRTITAHSAKDANDLVANGIALPVKPESKAVRPKRVVEEVKTTEPTPEKND